MQNDFALLQLKQVLSFGDLVYATCLNKKPFKDNNECLTTGWLTRDGNYKLRHVINLINYFNYCRQLTGKICKNYGSTWKLYCTSSQ